MNIDMLFYALMKYWWATIISLILIALLIYRQTLEGDAKRNFLSNITEKFIFETSWSFYLIDLRLGFKREGKWKCYLGFFKPVTQNFWNGIFTFNIYFVKAKNFPMIFPRFGLCSRFSYNKWFQMGIGWLFDRGEFGLKIVIGDWEKDKISNPGQWTIDGDPSTVTSLSAKGWEEGSI